MTFSDVVYIDGVTHRATKLEEGRFYVDHPDHPHTPLRPAPPVPRLSPAPAHRRRSADERPPLQPASGGQVKITKATPAPDGCRILTVRLEEGEMLFCIKQDCFYKLDYPLDGQVVASHILISPTRVVWDSLEQKWLDAE